MRLFVVFSVLALAVMGAGVCAARLSGPKGPLGPLMSTNRARDTGDYERDTTCSQWSGECAANRRRDASKDHEMCSSRTDLDGAADECAVLCCQQGGPVTATKGGGGAAAPQFSPHRFTLEQNTFGAVQNEVKVAQKRVTRAQRESTIRGLRVRAVSGLGDVRLTGWGQFAEEAVPTTCRIGAFSLMIKNFPTAKIVRPSSDDNEFYEDGQSPAHAILTISSLGPHQNADADRALGSGTASKDGDELVCESTLEVFVHSPAMGGEPIERGLAKVRVRVPSTEGVGTAKVEIVELLVLKSFVEHVYPLKLVATFTGVPAKVHPAAESHLRRKACVQPIVLACMQQEAEANLRPQKALAIESWRKVNVDVEFKPTTVIRARAGNALEAAICAKADVFDQSKGNYDAWGRQMAITHGTPECVSLVVRAKDAKHVNPAGCSICGAAHTTITWGLEADKCRSNEAATGGIKHLLAHELGHAFGLMHPSELNAPPRDTFISEMELDVPSSRGSVMDNGCSPLGGEEHKNAAEACVAGDMNDYEACMERANALYRLEDMASGQSMWHFNVLRSSMFTYSFGSTAPTPDCNGAPEDLNGPQSCHRFCSRSLRSPCVP